jgi:hypothetical protein
VETLGGVGRLVPGISSRAESWRWGGEESLPPHQYKHWRKKVATDTSCNVSDWRALECTEVEKEGWTGTAEGKFMGGHIGKQGTAIYQRMLSQSRIIFHATSMRRLESRRVKLAGVGKSLGPCT